MNVCILSDLNGKIELSGCEMKSRKTHVITLSYEAKTKRKHNFLKPKKWGLFVFSVIR